MCTFLLNIYKPLSPPMINYYYGGVLCSLSVVIVIKLCHSKQEQHDTNKEGSFSFMQVYVSTSILARDIVSRKRVIDIRGGVSPALLLYVTYRILVQLGRRHFMLVFFCLYQCISNSKQLEQGAFFFPFRSMLQSSCQV